MCSFYSFQKSHQDAIYPVTALICPQLSRNDLTPMKILFSKTVRSDLSHPEYLPIYN